VKRRKIMLKLVGKAVEVAMVVAGIPTKQQVAALEAKLKAEIAARQELAEALNDSETRRRQLEALLEPPDGSDLARWREANEEDLASPDPAVSQSEGVLAFHALLERVTLYRNALDRDKTGLGEALERVVHIATGYFWVTEGRGSYEWDDQRYRDETGRGLALIIDCAKDALRRSGALATAAIRDGVLIDPSRRTLGTAVSGLLIDEQRLTAVFEQAWPTMGFAEVFPMLPRWSALDPTEQKTFLRIGKAVLTEVMRLAGYVPEQRVLFQAPAPPGAPS
jgi:hypothetical protein